MQVHLNGAQNQKQMLMNTSNHHYFEVGCSMIPHQRKIEKGGEDAFCVNEKLIAVADGVSGWQSRGIDAGIYSKKLCQIIGELYNLDHFKYNQYPQQLLIDAARNNSEKGSSTCCILTLQNYKLVINSSYIGDSGYLILRKMSNDPIPDIQLIYESQEQVHSFNMPYQIGTGGDHPKLAKNFSHEIQPDDVIILATDGLFDNLSKDKIIDIIANSFDMNSGKIEKVEDLAKKLAKLAQQNSINHFFDSPFSQRARKKGIPIRGGKEDDITVIVAIVKAQQ